GRDGMARDEGHSLAPSSRMRGRARTGRVLPVALATALGVLLGAMPAPSVAEPPIFLGIYPDGPLQNRTFKIQELDNWISSTSRRIAMAGTFMDPTDTQFNPAWHVPPELGVIDNCGTNGARG